MAEGKDVQKWADKAMFTAEPLKASEGPKVYLLWMTPDPLGAVAAMAKMYLGEVVRDMDDVTDDERRFYMAEIQKTKLKAPLEAVKLHFMIEGVTRSFTHQMVRQRTAVYAQESLRFAVKEDMAEGVALPPSLAGTKARSEWMESEEANLFPSDEQKMRNRWDVVVDNIAKGYSELVNMGMPQEDARGLLPHNITTRLNYVTDLRALMDHAGNRLCTQAQFEWRQVFMGIANAIRNYGGWQCEALSDVFRPACYYEGKCGFMAAFDRGCKIRSRVDANAEANRPSTEWHLPLVDGKGAISPAEWLLDHTAAREKV